MVQDANRVLFTSYAKLPTGITATELYKVIGFVAVVDVVSETIVEAECTLATEVARDFISKIIVGHSLKEGIDSILKQVDSQYQGGAKKAIITAIRVVYDKYRSYKEGHTGSVLE